MRFKPITLSAVLVIALCGATKPADEPGQAAAASPFDAAFTLAAAPAPETSAPTEESAPPTEPSLDAAVLQTSEPAPAAAEASPVVEPTPPASDASPAAEPAPASAETASPTKPAFAKGKPPTKEYFVGIWAEEGQSCDTALDFKADGTLIGPFPRWELGETGELTMVGNRQKIFLTVVDANTIQSRRAPTDPPRTLKRCGG